MTKQTIAEIKKELESLSNPADPILKNLESDSRKGVQKLLKSWHRKNEKRQANIKKYERMMSYEKAALTEGKEVVMGIDEAGRGPLAGPVVAACVQLDPNHPIYGLDDSKKLSVKKRTQLFEDIKKLALSFGIGQSSSQEIDELGIRPATHLAMKRAYLACDKKADCLLIDAETIPLEIEQKKIIKGDQKSNSIAAASILAKHTRDQMMNNFHKKYPLYRFNEHMGYGTAHHLEALADYGPSPIHRHSFAPVKKFSK